MQTLTKVDFEISVQCTYLKKLGTWNEAGGEGHVPTSIQSSEHKQYSIQSSEYKPLQLYIFFKSDFRYCCFSEV